MTAITRTLKPPFDLFQYRKRYEVTCDDVGMLDGIPETEFQYRKRYEVTCDQGEDADTHGTYSVSIPQAV